MECPLRFGEGEVLITYGDLRKEAIIIITLLERVEREETFSILLLQHNVVGNLQQLTNISFTPECVAFILKFMKQKLQSHTRNKF